ncbi:MAG: glycosyltransferase N-terminal domain-containing protein [Acidobacteriota bacterium]
MYLLYSAALLLGILLAAPYFLYQILVNRKYLGSLGARLGFAQLPQPGPCLLIHCVSVGEFLAAEPLIERLRIDLPQYRLVISTTTATGQALACQRVAAFAEICYFPIDFAFSTQRFLAAINPAAIIILETELWPNFLHAAALRNIPVIIANGRISDRSFRRYAYVRFLLKPVLASISAFLMQSARDAERIVALGAPQAHVLVAGNLKYDLGSDAQLARFDLVAKELEERLELTGACPLLVAGSTTAGEEDLLLLAYQHLLAEPELANTRLLLAPRRPERFEEVAALLATTNLPFLRRSKIESDKAKKNLLGNGPGVILLDSIGELAAVYRYADLVFVGGSLVPLGGHNILEPALYGRAIVTGPYMNNFHKIMEDFVAAQAAVQLPRVHNGELAELLANELIRLLKDKTLRTELGMHAQQVLQANRGAVARHCREIVALVKSNQNVLVG